MARPRGAGPRPGVAAAVVAVVLALLATACTDGAGADSAPPAANAATEADRDTGLLAELRERGTVTVGIANEVPYGFLDESGRVTGEAPEVARLVLAELGVDAIEAEVVDFGSLIGGLQADRYDMIAAGMYINTDRAEQILFSDPDYCISEAFAVPEGNPSGLTDFASVVETGATIAILSGAVEEGYAETAGIPDDQVQLFSDVNAQYDALADGRVDAVAGTSLTVANQVESREGLEATDSFVPVDDGGQEILGCGGFGFRKENRAFRDAFNDQLNQLQSSGDLLPVITRFGFAEDDVRRAEELTVADLTQE